MKYTVKKVAKDLGIEEREVNKVYSLYWKFIRKTIESFDIKESFDREKFESTPHYFNLQGLGKLDVVVKDSYRDCYARYIQSKEGESTVEPCTPDCK